MEYPLGKGINFTYVLNNFDEHYSKLKIKNQ